MGQIAFDAVPKPLSSSFSPLSCIKSLDCHSERTLIQEKTLVFDNISLTLRKLSLLTLTTLQIPAYKGTNDKAKVTVHSRGYPKNSESGSGQRIAPNCANCKCQYNRRHEKTEYDSHFIEAPPQESLDTGHHNSSFRVSVIQSTPKASVFLGGRIGHP